MFFLPVVTSAAIIGIVMTFVFSPFNGPVNKALLTSGLIDQPIDLARMYSQPDALTAHIAALDAFVQANPDSPDGALLAGFVRYAAGDAQTALSIFRDRANTARDDTLMLILRDAAMRAVRMQEAAEHTLELDATPGVANELPIA